MPLSPSDKARRLAFFDFDGTLVSSNVVHQYVWYARRRGAWARLAALAACAPVLKLTDAFSREAFNRMFYRHYAGLPEPWLRSESERLLEDYLIPHMFPGAPALLERVRGEGFACILVSGSLDFSVEPFARRFGFLRTLSNRLEFAAGKATGRLLPPILAGGRKVEAIRAIAGEYNIGLEHCRAYSDDAADLPMLEAVGFPTAANPKPGLLREAQRRNWPVIHL